MEGGVDGDFEVAVSRGVFDVRAGEAHDDLGLVSNEL